MSLIAFSGAGCESAAQPKPSAVTSVPAMAAASEAPNEVKPANHIAKPGDNSTAVAPKTVELREMDWKQVQKLVADQKGKVVVVDIWSTACTPCLREFPSLVALQKQHPDDVVCFSFDCDYAGAKKKPVAYYQERVLKALVELQAENLINAMSTTAADELFQQLDLDSIPAVYVFDRAGKLAKRFDNRTPASKDDEGISYEIQINPLVSQLVKAAQE